MRFATLSLLAALLPAVSFAAYKASSTKASAGGTADVDEALDGDPTTAWQIDPEQDNAGQWIEIEVPAGKVDKLSVLVGWLRDAETWGDYARLKTAKIQVLDGGKLGPDNKPAVVHEVVHTFTDTQSLQVVDLPDVTVGQEAAGGWVRLTVVDVYEGKDFSHLALGEALVHLAEFDAQTVKVSGDLPASADGHPATALTDGDGKTFWASATDGVGASFTADAGRYNVSSIGLLPGPKSHARPKVIEVEQGGATRRYDVPDTAGPHWFTLPALHGYSGSNYGAVTVKVVETYAGATSPQVGVAEVKFKATSLDAF